MTRGAKREIKQVFFYVAHKGIMPKKDHAQCRSCMMWGEENICMAHGLYDEIIGAASCEGYAEGKPHADMKMLKEMTDKNGGGSWTKEESGYTEGEFRCENCIHADMKRVVCLEMEDAIKARPDKYHGSVAIRPQDCCNEQQSVSVEQHDDKNVMRKRYNKG